ncbi:hypothetical protein CEP51_004988 [Fusarium floridanum]|uniref:Uncharacterized protein n=1 Tax=Fusarium floridanum TaxID=1325733 RepID=A0A428RYS0_9HYPO|nr:hypothetical protein CEP51_004988 [Fusarium floridanum]
MTPTSFHLARSAITQASAVGLSQANASTTVMATVDSNTCRVVVGVERGAAVLRALNSHLSDTRGRTNPLREDCL